jgi:predicted SAM-dependent methyltransferase
VEFYETSNVSTGHSTHHQGHRKLKRCKRVLWFIGKVEIVVDKKEYVCWEKVKNVIKNREKEHLKILF